MPRDNSAQDRLWTLIEARKQDGRMGEDPPRLATRPEPEAAEGALVEALYRVVHVADATADRGGSAARSMLQAAIVADTAARKFRRTRWLAPWRLAGTRQVLAAAALLLITVAAIAYTVWSTRRLACVDYGAASVAAPPPASALPIGVSTPLPIRPKGSKIDAVTSKSGIKGASAVEAPCKP
ncbi:MAG TPA: hypothetical protein VKT77_20325 [Chthonomonadaceae bacterium]|nr:hypothetical protein [Chthonomonadaceae bacterium]